MAYLRFVWFKLKNTVTGEEYIQRWAENAHDGDITDAIHQVCDVAVAHDSVVIGGPFKTKKQAFTG